MDISSNLWYIISFILLILIALYIFIEPYWFNVKKIEIEFEDLPEEFNGFTITHISDTHISKQGFFEKKLAHLFKYLPETDICLITGDLVYNEKAVPIFIETVKNIKSRNGSYFVSGNSEYKSHNNHLRLISTISRIGGIKNIDNNHIELYKEGNKIEIIGIDESSVNKADINTAFKGTSKNNFKIALVHCPSLTRDIIPYSPNLILAGHTHGGQVRLPFNIIYTHMPKDKTLNDSFFTPDKISKIIKKDVKKSHLLVNRGLGTSNLWIRFRCRPELYLITLKKKK